MSWVVTTYSSRVLVSKRLGSRACSAWVGGGGGGSDGGFVGGGENEGLECGGGGGGGGGGFASSRGTEGAEEHFVRSMKYLREERYPVAAEEMMHMYESRCHDEVTVGWTSDVEAVGGDDVTVLQTLPRLPSKASAMVRERELRLRGCPSEILEQARRRSELANTPQPHVVYEVVDEREHPVYIGLTAGTAVSQRVKRDWLRIRAESLSGDYSFRVLETFDATPSEALVTKVNWIQRSVAKGYVLMNREAVGFSRRTAYSYEVLDEKGRRVHTGFSVRPQAKEVALLKKKLILRHGYTYRYLRSVEPQTVAAHVQLSDEDSGWPRRGKRRR